MPLHPDVLGFVRSYVAPNAAAMAQGVGPSPKEVLYAAGRHDLAGLLLPVEYGGADASHVDFVDAVEQIAAACASTSVILDVHLSVAVYPLLLLGNEAQKQEFLPGMASGERLGAFALTEAQSGSDAAGMQASARRSGTTYRLSGSKVFITNGGAADVAIVVLRTSQDKSGISAFILDCTTPGVSWGAPLHKMGLRGSMTRELILEDVEIDASCRLGDEGDGFKIAMRALDVGRFGIAAQAVGIAHAAVTGMAVNGQVDEMLLATLGAQVSAARQLCLFAALLADAGQPLTEAAAIAKLYATDVCVAATQAAVDFAAPASGADDHPAAIRFRDAKASQIYEGTNQIQRVVVARQLLRGGA